MDAKTPWLRCANSQHNYKSHADPSHVTVNYRNINILMPHVQALRLHSKLSCPVISTQQSMDAMDLTMSQNPNAFQGKVDMIVTFGGDGTILRAASLFNNVAAVPPILSFNLGSLGFLSEWNFKDFKHAWAQVFYSNGSTPPGEAGPMKSAKVLLRSRLRVAIVPAGSTASSQTASPYHVLNELLIHRGQSPHLAHLTLTLDSRPLTTAIADGLLVATPTGSTAYSLSAGGAIVHPLVKSLLVTPVCARSLSFRPLVLPPEGPLEIRVAEGTRAVGPTDSAGAAIFNPHLAVADEGGRVDVSIDGIQIPGGLAVGGQVKVWGEPIALEPGSVDPKYGPAWLGGVPCITRGSRKGRSASEEGWAGGLNNLLGFNHPFGQASKS